MAKVSSSSKEDESADLRIVHDGLSVSSQKQDEGLDIHIRQGDSREKHPNSALNDSTLYRESARDTTVCFRRIENPICRRFEVAKGNVFSLNFFHSCASDSIREIQKVVSRPRTLHRTRVTSRQALQAREQARGLRLNVHLNSLAVRFDARRYTNDAR